MIKIALSEDHTLVFNNKPYYEAPHLYYTEDHPRQIPEAIIKKARFILKGPKPRGFFYIKVKDTYIKSMIRDLE